MILFSGVAADTADFSGSFFWPLKLDKQISSGFGDGRPGRFHMGLDLRTGGREGASVYAPEDGYVWRIKTAYNGYGVGLYLRGVSGRTYVFGHLQALNKTIGSFLERKQLENRRYYQDLQLTPEALPVKRGNRVAYSGQTGTGAPHLHFEVRDAQDRPTNPLLYRNIGLRDTTPPKIPAIWFAYCDSASLFPDGAREMKLVPQLSAGARIIRDTILITGRFGVKAAAEDFPAPGSFLIAPMRLRLEIDGRLYHGVTYDRLGFGDNRYSLLDRDSDPGRAEYKRVYNMFRLKGNETSCYLRGAVNDGTFADTVAGFHTLRLEVADAAGNSTIVTATFFYTPADKIVAATGDIIVSDTLIILPLEPSVRRAVYDTLVLYGIGGKGSEITLRTLAATVGDSLFLYGKFDRHGRFRLLFRRHGLDFPAVLFSAQAARPRDVRPTVTADVEIRGNGLALAVRASSNDLNRLAAQVITDRGDFVLPMRRIDENRFVAYFQPPDSVRLIRRIVVSGSEDVVPDTIDLMLSHLLPDRPDTVALDQKTELIFAGKGLFDGALISISDTAMEGPRAGGFVRPPFAIRPSLLALADAAKLQMQFDLLPDTVRTGLCLYRGERRWRWLGGSIDSGAKRLSAAISGGGVYAVLTDTTPPVVSGLNIEDRSSITSNRPAIRCAVSDDLSGFEDDRNFELTIDGKWIIPVYDPEHGVLTGTPHWNIFGTSHTLQVTVRDRCGNTTTVTRTFHVLSRTGPKK